MHEGAGTPWPPRAVILRPARISWPLLVPAVLGLGVGFGVHWLTANTAARGRGA